VITHLARNADAHGRRLAGALQGEDVAKYPGGAAQREREIAEGAGRPARSCSQIWRRARTAWRSFSASAQRQVGPAENCAKERATQ
jgi:hypothetical protein